MPQGLQRLKEHAIIATLTNGNVSLMVDVARHAKLPWDMIFAPSYSSITSLTLRFI
ncbi:hypothetical protein HSBAA_44820 [Vreelandella sulfidaeris]|uniref:Uncharacterized protein n=1 Tax=Vreelandella sulfidaeris TaxID=115553 RepID=A0A455UAF3_9GAMM|nr:hypothetical protein HSBAA_44820 [Halomonas sulfidaeris]